VFEGLRHCNGSIAHSRIHAGGLECLRRRPGKSRSALIEGSQPISEFLGECAERFVEGVGWDRGWKVGCCPSRRLLQRTFFVSVCIETGPASGGVYGKAKRTIRVKPLSAAGATQEGIVEMQDHWDSLRCGDAEKAPRQTLKALDRKEVGGECREQLVE
jgi:hypothetical protein